MTATSKLGVSAQARVKFHALITSYETALSEGKLLKHLEWESLVVDEGHRLKNKNSRLFTVGWSQVACLIQAFMSHLLLQDEICKSKSCFCLGANRLETLYPMLSAVKHD